MASTYTVANATTYVRPFIKNAPVSTIEVTAADYINSIIWNAYPWRWAMSVITSIALVDGTQDYTFAPNDYFRLAAARLTRTDTTPDQYDELKVLRNLHPELTKAGFKAGLSSIAYSGVLGKLRLNFAAAVPTGVTVQIDGEYQKQPTKITANSATFPFPDQYFPVFIEGYKWQLFLFADDPKAGSCQQNKRGDAVYTGQMGIFYDALMSMREAEEWGAGDAIFPDDPLGAYRNSNPNIFGP